MKNKSTIILLLITGVFLSLTLGIFLGGKLKHDPVSVSSLTPDTTQSPSGATGKLNINTATLEQLCELPGIGEVLAGNIISYRELNGNFTDIFQLKNVKGIGNKLFSSIYNLITVGE